MTPLIKHITYRQADELRIWVYRTKFHVKRFFNNSFQWVERLMCCIHACLYIVRIMNEMYIECYLSLSLYKYTLKVQ